MPATSSSRTLNDCAKSGLSPELLRQAAQQALRRGLVTRNELAVVDARLEPETFLRMPFMSATPTTAR
ncbi:MAG TPA: hypothetical protein VM580_22815, partial [Labilithrix sp.]|nr:hypothetical protein [Labilithrix sp.]